MSDSIETARKQNSVGVESEKAQAHAEGVTASVEDAPETISIKEYVDRRFAQQDAKNGQARAETQKDLEKVRAGNAELNAKMDTGFAKLRAEMDARFAELRAENVELRAEFVELRAEMDARFAELRAGNAELRAGNVELRAEMDTRFVELRAEMDTRFAELHAKVDTGFAELRLEMQTGFAENKASQLHQLRWIVGAIFAAGSLIIAAGFFT